MDQFFSDFAILYGIEGAHPQRAFMLLFATIFVLSAIVYRLGFAKKLPVLKTAVVYFFLAIGCFVMTIFAERFPVVKCLIVIAIVFGGYKFRLHRSKKNEEINGNKA
ncbi:MAG TPA: YlaH-like family protein [Bacillales bacterium]|nr:YlaH-like family protein [Bacillales bacterium]